VGQDPKKKKKKNPLNVFLVLRNSTIWN